MRARERWIAASLVLTSFALYAVTGAHYVLGGDNAEFLVVAETGGVAHPSGYPLYVLYLQVVRAGLPIIGPYAAALATSVLGALAVGTLFLAARRWGATTAAALLASLLYAFSPRAWIASTHAEVFALNSLFAALLLTISAPVYLEQAPTNPLRRCAQLGLVAGLALSNHLTAALLAPVGIVAAVRTIAACSKRWLGAVIGLLGLTIGLLPYLTILVAARQASPWSWGHPTTLSALFAHIARRDYGTLQLGLNDQGASATEHITWLAEHLLSDLSWLPLVFLPLGVVAMFTRPATTPGRTAERWALLVTLLTTGPLLVSRFSLSQNGVELAIVERFYLLPELVACLIVSVGFTWFASRLSGFISNRQSAALTLFSGLLIAAVPVLRFWDEVAEHHSPAVQRYLENTLESSLPQAIILGTGDHRLFGFSYLQGALHVRPDVTYVDPRMLHYSWYRERQSQLLGVALVEPQVHSVSTAELASQLLQTGRPVFLSNAFTSRIVSTFPSYPHGLLIRILPPGASLPPPDQVLALNLELVNRFRLDYPEPVDPHSWASSVQQEYARTWDTMRRAANR